MGWCYCSGEGTEEGQPCCMDPEEECESGCGNFCGNTSEDDPREDR